MGAVVTMSMAIGMTVAAVNLMVGGSVRLEGRLDGRNELSLAMMRVREELRLAETFTELSGNAVTITRAAAVAGDPADVIRYAWSGTLDDPLTRQVNDGSVLNLIPKCTGFQLAVDASEVIEGEEQTWGPDNTVASFDQYPLGLLGSLLPASADNNEWKQIYFRAHRSGATKCLITSVILPVARHWSSYSGNLLVSLRPAPDGPPTVSSTVLGEVALPLSSLSTSFEWRSLTFPDGVEIPVDVGTAVIMRTDTSSDAYFSYATATVLGYDNGTSSHASTNSGASWTPSSYNTTSSHRFYIIGRYDDEYTGSGYVEGGFVDNLFVTVSIAREGQTLAADSALHCLNHPPLGKVAISDLPIR
jgi:hypothetical protein